jgi:hypothetical protein
MTGFSARKDPFETIQIIEILRRTNPSLEVLMGLGNSGGKEVKSKAHGFLNSNKKQRPLNAAFV